MIERCKRNKAKRDPNGTFQRDRKVINKARRARAKVRARHKAERDRLNAEALKYDLAEIEKRVLAWQVGPGLAIQMGKSLPIDNYLQGRLMG